MSISWYNDKRIQLKSDDAKDTSELLIDPVNISDAGVYTCQAYNHPKLIAEEQISLTVKCTYMHVIVVRGLPDRFIYDSIALIKSDLICSLYASIARTYWLLTNILLRL